MPQLSTTLKLKRISIAVQITLATATISVPMLANAANGSSNNVVTNLNYTDFSTNNTIAGGYVPSGQTGDASNNTITLDNIDADEIHGGRVLGTGAVSNNKVELTGGTADLVSGGIVDLAGTGTASGNHAIIHSGTFQAVVGGMTNGGHATGNTVTVNNGTFTYISGGEVAGGTGNATNNTVIINGGTISSAIIGGHTTLADTRPTDTPTGNATNNTVIINGNNANLTNASLYGGAFVDASSNPIAGSGNQAGNTLNLVGVNGLSIKSVQNFESLNFHLPENTANGDTILTVTGTADIRGSTIGLAVQGDAPTLKAGDKVTLINAGTLQADSTIKTTALQGSTIQYDFTTTQDGNKLVSTVAGGQATEAAKSTAEGFVAGAAALTAAADFASGQGMSAAIGAVATGSNAGGGTNFGTTGGGSVRNKTGSHVDVRSFNIVAGIAKGLKLNSGELTLGGFFEYGVGNYSSFNNFTTGQVRGDGDTRSYGLGILAHHEFLSKFYVEGSIRGGQAKQDYRSVDLVPGVLSSYDSSTNYYGMHVGVGKKWALSETLDLDTYAQYIWQRQGSDTVTMSTGEKLEFGAVNSHRGRIGTRLIKAVAERISVYTGAAYEYEFDGKANAKTNGMPITSPSMKGGNGMIELGVIARPSASTKGLTLSLGINGYMGQKEGFTGNLNIGYKF